MLSYNSCPDSQVAFYGRPNLRKRLPKVKAAINRTFSYIDAPNYIQLNSTKETIYLNGLNHKLKSTREMNQKNLDSGNVKDYFDWLFYFVRGFKVANCSEMAEIAKATLKINGIKNCDVFQLYACKPNSSEPPRELDHIIAAINVPKSKNNKKTLKPFIPSPKTKIVDLWLNTFFGTIKGARQRYGIFGIKPDEVLMLSPVRILEPDKATLQLLRTKYPSIVVK